MGKLWLATAGRRPRAPVDQLQFPQDLLLSMVARWQESGPGARRFSFGSGVDSEFSREVVRTRFGRLRTSCLPYGNYLNGAYRKIDADVVEGDFWPPWFNFRIARHSNNRHIPSGLRYSDYITRGWFGFPSA